MTILSWFRFGMDGVSFDYNPTQIFILRLFLAYYTYTFIQFEKISTNKINKKSMVVYLQLKISYYNTIIM